MRAELPRSLAYLSSILLRDLAHPAWWIVRTEWAVEVCRDLLYQARNKKLYWIPEAVRSDMNIIGVRRAFGASGEGVVKDLEVLLDYVDGMRWSLCPKENRYSVPERTKQTPVFLSGDYFEFDPVNWRVIADDAMFIPRDDEGRLQEPLDDHGERFHGVTAGKFPTRTNPSGYSRGQGVDYVGHKPQRGRGGMKRGGRSRWGGRDERRLVVRETRELIPRDEDMDVDTSDDSPIVPTVPPPTPPSLSGAAQTPSKEYYERRVVGQLREMLTRAMNRSASPVVLQSPARPSLDVITTMGSSGKATKELPDTTIPKEVANTDKANIGSSSSVRTSAEAEGSVAGNDVMVVDLTGDEPMGVLTRGGVPVKGRVTLHVKQEVALEREVRAPDGDRLTEDTENYEEDSS